MIPFSNIAEPLRALLLILLVLTFLMHLLSFYLRRVLKEKRSWMSLAAALCIFPLIPLLCPGQDPLYRFQTKVPLIPMLVVLTALTAYSVRRFTNLIRTWNSGLTPFSIKEALEQMPIGIAYFDDRGRLVLSNRKMEHIVFQLTGRDLQILDDLEHGLMYPPDDIRFSPMKDTLLFPDGTARHFVRQQITDCEGTVYTEWTASDITEQERLHNDLDEKNRHMQGVIARMQSISVQTADLVREQEILAAKMRVHHQMGNLLLLTRRYLSGQGTDEDRSDLVHQWREGLHSLQTEVESRDETDMLEEVIRVADTLGVHVEVYGSVPDQQGMQYLLTAALRECVTNTLRHAGGNCIYLLIMQTHDGLKAVYSNNGMQPHAPIREGGGLSSLRKTVENAGGTMFLTAEPDFRLTLLLPEIMEGDEHV